jgi:hypothetical protein
MVVGTVTASVKVVNAFASSLSIRALQATWPFVGVLRGTEPDYTVVVDEKDTHQPSRFSASDRDKITLPFISVVSDSAAS